MVMGPLLEVPARVPLEELAGQLHPLSFTSQESRGTNISEAKKYYYRVRLKILLKLLTHRAMSVYWL
jgi:hypothetical protein